MSNRICRACLPAVLCLAATAVVAQEPEAVFRTQSDLVVLHVTVLDGRSDAVPNLPQEAFRVFDEDEPQQIVFFSSADVPVAVGLVLDASASMIARHGLAVAGASAFARSSRPGDEMFTIHFNDEVRFGLPAGMAFTSRASLLQASVVQYRAGGRTALYDAVHAGLDHLESASAQKRVLVVLSDGDDNASRLTERDMIERARRSNAVVYTVSNANRRNGLAGDPGVLRRLAEVSGGIAYFPATEDQIAERFDRIAEDIRRGYTIGYVPASGRKAGYHRIRVEASAPDRRRLDVKSRPGYWVTGNASLR